MATMTPMATNHATMAPGTVTIHATQYGAADPPFARALKPRVAALGAAKIENTSVQSTTGYTAGTWAARAGGGTGVPACPPDPVVASHSGEYGSLMLIRTPAQGALSRRPQDYRQRAGTLEAGSDPHTGTAAPPPSPPVPHAARPAAGCGRVRSPRPAGPGPSRAAAVAVPGWSRRHPA